MPGTDADGRPEFTYNPLGLCTKGYVWSQQLLVAIITNGHDGMLCYSSQIVSVKGKEALRVLFEFQHSTIRVRCNTIQNKNIIHPYSAQSQ